VSLHRPPLRDYGGAGFSKSIPLLGSPAIPIAASAYGVRRLFGLWDLVCVEFATGASQQIALSSPRNHLTISHETTKSWKLVPCNYMALSGSSSRDLRINQSVTM
jgi:hypothetical protein